VQRELHGARRARPARHGPRPPEVDDGWLCDKGRFAYQSVHVDERITSRSCATAATCGRSLGARARRGRHGAGPRARARRRAGGHGATNEEGFLLGRLLREGLESRRPRLARRRTCPPTCTARWPPRRSQATVPDLECAHAVLVLDCEPVDDAPILDLRLRKGVRRHGVRLAVASSRPSSLDPNAALSVRFAPGGGGAFAAALAGALSGEGDLERLAGAAGAEADGVRSLARCCATPARTSSSCGASG
jgi:NADH-quinone oxidoreductase subunit G